MRHPFNFCATRDCCFCFSLPPDVTCLLIAFLCITGSAFSGLTNFGVDHWALYIVSILNFCLHLVAGVLLLLGTLWRQSNLKLAYCWCLFFGIFTAAAGFITFLVLPTDRYIIWGSKCYNFNNIIGAFIVVFHGIWLMAFDFYSSLLVLGNLYPDVDEYCSDDRSLNNA